MAFDIAPYGQAITETSAFLNGILKRVFPEKMSELDAAKMQQELTMALVRGEHEPIMAQLRVNEKEAAHDSIFVAGWRPFIGWVCGVALAWQFIGLQLALFVSRLYQIELGPLPQFDYASLSPILLGMLGLGAMRSYEKVKGESTTATKVGS